MIDVTKPLSYDGGFPRVDNALYRLYPLLDDFTIETVGLYGYLKSWSNREKGHELFGCVWLTLAEMEAQTGLSYYRLTKHVKLLKKYGLIRERRARRTPNKKVFEVLEPLTEAEFRAEYPDAIKAFKARLDGIEVRIEEDRERRARKREEADRKGTDIA